MGIIHTFSQFSHLLTILLMLQIGVGIYGTVRRDQAELVLEKVFNETLTKYNVNREVWEFMQKEVTMKFQNDFCSIFQFELETIVFNARS